MRRLTSVLLVSLALLSVGATSADALPPVKHVFVVLLENENYADTFGADSPAPYLAKSLPARGALLPNYYATGHLSLDNYLAMISGQAPNSTTQADCPVFSELTPGTLREGRAGHRHRLRLPGARQDRRRPAHGGGPQLARATWRTWPRAGGQSKSCRRPKIGAPDPTQAARVGDQYAARHNPFVYFQSLVESGDCKRYDVDYARLGERPRARRARPRASRSSHPTSATTATTRRASTARRAACHAPTRGCAPGPEDHWTRPASATTACWS